MVDLVDGLYLLARSVLYDQKGAVTSAPCDIFCHSILIDIPSGLPVCFKTAAS